MKKIILLIALYFVAHGCSAQHDEVNETNDSLKTNKPQENIIVNKEYDDKGNLVRFDSSYSYYYSNMQNDSTFGDSTYLNFQSNFFNTFPGFQQPYLDNLFFEDSLLFYDFYKDDFFSNRFKNNRLRFDKLFEKMDSMKNNYYEQFNKLNKKK